MTTNAFISITDVVIKIIKMLKNKPRQKILRIPEILTTQQQLNSDQFHDESRVSSFYLCQGKLLF